MAFTHTTRARRRGWKWESNREGGKGLKQAVCRRPTPSRRTNVPLENVGWTHHGNLLFFFCVRNIGHSLSLSSWFLGGILLSEVLLTDRDCQHLCVVGPSRFQSFLQPRSGLLRDAWSCYFSTRDTVVRLYFYLIRGFFLFFFSRLRGHPSFQKKVCSSLPPIP